MNSRLALVTIIVTALAGLAMTAYNAIGKSCKGCHDSHRESMPDKSFRIKP
jgi:cytochrome c556